LDHRGKAFVDFVIAGCDSPELFQIAEQILNQGGASDTSRNRSGFGPCGPLRATQMPPGRRPETDGWARFWAASRRAIAAEGSRRTMWSAEHLCVMLML
jgi:hypothetical protein